MLHEHVKVADGGGDDDDDDDGKIQKFQSNIISHNDATPNTNSSA